MTFDLTRRYPRRIEAIDLRPGDQFEYERYSKYSQPQRQMVKDRVTSMRGADPKKGVWRARVLLDSEDGSEAISSITLYTEIGSNNHGYVRLKSDVVVLLLDPDDGREQCPACSAKYQHVWHCPVNRKEKGNDPVKVREGETWLQEKYPAYYNEDGTLKADG